MTMWNQMADTHVVAYLNGVATDITRYVLVPPRGGQINSARGRQTELAQMDPSRMSLVLENRDGRFTPGNPSSPYYPYWRQGVRMVWTETLGAITFTHFDGSLEIPEVQLNYQAADPTINDALLAVSTVDTLTRLDRARRFISTLAEFIVDAGGTTLVVYLPMNEPVGPTFSDPRQSFSLSESSNYLFGGIPVAGHALVDYGSATALPADELTGAVYDPLVDASGAFVKWGQHDGSLPTPLIVDAGKSVAIACWVNFRHTFTDIVRLLGLTGPAGCYMQFGVDGTAGTWTASVEDFTGLVGPTTGKAYNVDAWRLVALRLTESTGVVEFWHHGAAPETSTIAGATTAQFTGIQITGQASVAMMAVQVYYGAGAYTRAQHLAQVAAGFSGLERQTTGERIRTVARYAGVSASALDHIDDGSTVMQRASLAGKTPLAAMQEAADAERGRLFTAGDGSIVFHDRHRIYNT